MTQHIMQVFVMLCKHVTVLCCVDTSSGNYMSQYKYYIHKHLGSSCSLSKKQWGAN